MFNPTDLVLSHYLLKVKPDRKHYQNIGLWVKIGILQKKLNQKSPPEVIVNTFFVCFFLPCFHAVKGIWLELALVRTYLETI
jgi:hypothetical protein